MLWTVPLTLTLGRDLVAGLGMEADRGRGGGGAALRLGRWGPEPGLREGRGLVGKA